MGSVSVVCVPVCWEMSWGSVKCWMHVKGKFSFHVFIRTGWVSCWGEKVPSRWRSHLQQSGMEGAVGGCFFTRMTLSLVCLVGVLGHTWQFPGMVLCSVIFSQKVHKLAFSFEEGNNINRFRNNFLSLPQLSPLPSSLL